MAKEKFVEIASRLAAAVNFEGSPISPWPHRYRCIEPSPGARVIVEESDELTICDRPARHLANRLVAWTRLNGDPRYMLTLKRAAEVADMWLAIADPIPLSAIKSVRWADDPGYTWRRLPWSASEGPCPTWDTLLSRMTNKAAFCAWLGSLFFEDARQHQYVWCHGRGNDGKGAINRFLKRVFGRAYRSKQPPAMGDKFWAYGLLGARLVVFPDCNSQSFTTGGFFKSLSGGDPIDVEAKGQMSFTAELNSKFLFFSNEKPVVTSEHADMRRIIFCEFTEKGEKEQGFEDRLWEEGGAFMFRCVAEYGAVYPTHADIEADTDDIKTWVSVVEEKFQTIFDKHFMQPHESHRCHAGLAQLSLSQIDLLTVIPAELLTIVEDAFRERKDQAAFRDWLYKKYGAQKRGIKLIGNETPVFYRYVGISRKVLRSVSTMSTSRHPNPMS